MPTSTPPTTGEQHTARRPSGRRERSRGQSLVEFGISLPLVLLMVLFGVDFGRVFLGWLSLGGAAREAANFAALNPFAWVDNSTSAKNEYDRLIQVGAGASNCTLPSTLPAPSFPNGYTLGSPVVVALSCQFSLLTPLIGNILGSAVSVSASAAFPIRSGPIEGVPVQTAVPTPSASPVPTAGPSSGSSPTPAPSVVPNCTVPDFRAIDTSAAVDLWVGAGFTANKLVFSPLVPPHYVIKTQSIRKDSNVLCSSTMTVTP